MDVRDVLRHCRPDREIGGAGRRAAWDGGDRGSFFPYGKTEAQLFAEQD